MRLGFDKKAISWAFAEIYQEGSEVAHFIVRRDVEELVAEQLNEAEIGTEFANVSLFRPSFLARSAFCFLRCPFDRAIGWERVAQQIRKGEIERVARQMRKGR